MRRFAALLFLTVVAAAGPKERLPADCVVVHSFDFAALRRTEAWDRIAGPIGDFLKEVVGLEGLFEGTGFRPATDLDALTFALGGDPARHEVQVYAIARGRLDAKRFAECLAQAGIRPVERDGMTVFEDKASAGRITCAFPGAFGLLDGTLLFADPAAGLDALRAAASESAPRGQASARLEAAPDAHAWTVFSPTPAFREAMKREPEGTMFAAVTSGTVAFRIGARFEATLEAEVSDADTAEQVLAFARAGLAGLGLGDRAVLDRAGTRLHGKVALPLEEAMTLLGMPVEAAGSPGTSARPVVRPGGPELKGDGRLEELALPGQVNRMAVSPDGTCVLVDRALESDVVLDADLRIVSKTREAAGCVAYAPDGRSALWMVHGRPEVRTVPALTPVAPAEPLEYGGLSTVWALCPCADGKSFVAVDWGVVRIVRTGPLTWGPSGKPALVQPIAGALDARTGLLVMTGDKTGFEIFDAERMESVATLSLPAPVTFDVAAADGRAWIGTKGGHVLPVDIAARRVLPPVRVGDGDVSLTLSGSGRTLVAAAQQWVDGHHHPTRIVAYALDGGELRAVAAAEFVAPGAFQDLALLESTRTVLLGGDPSLVWRYGSPDDSAATPGR